jgi:hypothetical protein
MPAGAVIVTRMAPVSPGAANALPATAIPAVSISAAEPMNIARGYRLTSISDFLTQRIFLPAGSRRQI